jgi:hypothetical protein
VLAYSAEMWRRPTHTALGYQDRGCRGKLRCSNWGRASQVARPN